ncbi:unnamed protein product [Enterobius vermicularis]|uniref:Exostosin domain-containing protein n=1 Tax=Enterobius vermicularis TaxID=51028 RepID=A0A0N4V8P5_ENTVE|nr:unnamed protein product [Enterobius vermicularis]
MGGNLIRRTTSADFETVVMKLQLNKDAVVFFSGGDWHGPSSSVFYVYHTVANYFRQFADGIQFFMIDVSKNELPWPYKMEKLPAAIFFPAKRSVHPNLFLKISRLPLEFRIGPTSSFLRQMGFDVRTRVKCYWRSFSANLPASVPFTVPNLISFITAHCGPELRWRIALSSCSELCLRRNKIRLRKRAATLVADIVVLRSLKRDCTEVQHKKLIGASIYRLKVLLRIVCPVPGAG